MHQHICYRLQCRDCQKLPLHSCLHYLCTRQCRRNRIEDNNCSGGGSSGGSGGDGHVGANSSSDIDVVLPQPRLPSPPLLPPLPPPLPLPCYGCPTAVGVTCVQPTAEEAAVAVGVGVEVAAVVVMGVLAVEDPGGGGGDSAGGGGRGG